MRRLWMLMIAVLAFGGLAAVAPTAGATVPSASAKFCKDIQKLGNSSQDLSNAASLKTKAKAIAAEFKAASKHASGNVKKAMNTIASFIGSLGTTNVADLAKVYSSTNFKNYTKAIGTYVSAAATCG